MTKDEHLHNLVRKAEELGAEHFESDSFNQPPGAEFREATAEFEPILGGEIDAVLARSSVAWGAVALRAHELVHET